MLQLNILYLCYILWVKPLDSHSAALQEAVNEILLQMITYCVLLTSWRNFFKSWGSDFDESLENEMTIQFDKWLGRCVIELIVGLQIFNLIVIFGITIRDMRHKLRLKRMQKNQEKGLKINKAAPLSIDVGKNSERASN